MWMPLLALTALALMPAAYGQGCEVGCATCNDKGNKCKVCEAGFKGPNRNGLCKEEVVITCQVANCLECSETGLKCKPDKCEEGYRRVVDGTCKSTACAVDNCAECNEKGNKCVTCNEGYKRKSDGSCSEIIIPDCIVEHCLECTETGRRCAEDKCEEGYKRDRKGQCNDCDQPNCYECRPGGGKCMEGQCHDGYKLTRKGTCNLCGVDFCHECNANGKKCLKTECFEGYRYFRGQCFEIPAEPCNPDPCKNGGTCNEDDGSCTCEEGFIGMTCEEVDPCKNGGSFNEEEEVCECPSGFSGENCETADKPDPCDPNPCQNGGECSDGDCTCAAGFLGVNCETKDPCEPNPCQNDGTCSAGACTCASGFLGDKCETKDPCEPNPCQNGGSCSDGDCTCASGFLGDNCETKEPEPAPGTEAPEPVVIIDPVEEEECEDDTGCTLEHIGCWADKGSKHIIPLITKEWRNKACALENCLAAAHEKEYPAFGLQFGGVCRSGPQILETYDGLGKVDRCENGRGGPVANDVYKINCDVGGSWPEDEPCYAQLDRKAFGDDVVKPVTTANAKECAALCDKTDGCEFWNWYDERAVKSYRRKCAMKHQFRKIHNQKKATTGRKNCNVPAPGGKDPVDPVPVDPVPVDPVPVDPIPVDPVPVDPIPVDPVPVVDPTANCPETSDKCVTGKFRLEGKGSNSKKGRVEYCGKKCKWGTVCDDGFKQDEGDMVCKELGFTRATKIYGDHVKGKSNIPDKHPYGRGVGKPVLIDDLRCPKGASSLSQCSYKPNINVNCLHYEDTAVICA